MTIAILKLEAGQKIARPFNRASSAGEAAEVIANFAGQRAGLNRKQQAEYSATAERDPRKFLTMANLDSEQPIFVFAEAGTTGVQFFAFTE